MSASLSLGQEFEPEVRSIMVDDWLVSSAAVRSIALLHGLDRDNDQFLSEDELEPALRQAEISVRNERRHNGMVRSRGSFACCTRGTLPSAVRRSSRGNSLTAQRLARLRLVSRELSGTDSFELSLVSEEFHRLFAGLPGEQRAALLEADVDGNNDGNVTAREFYEDTRRMLSSKTRFESDFGEAAYLEVLRRFGVL